MSTDHQPTTRHAATCAAGVGCAEVDAGHAMHPLQRTVAAATPSSWLDAVVGQSHADGWTVLHALADGREIAVWHHAPAPGAAPGEPVALHPAYHVLAVAGQWLNVLVDGER